MKRLTLPVILAIGLLVRLAFLVINFEVTTLPQGGADALGFERLAWEFSRGHHEALSHYLASGSQFFALLGSYIYAITGRAPYALGLTMVLLGVGVIMIVYRASFDLWGDAHVARIAACCAALFPQLILHSVLFLREMPVSFCVAAATLCAIRYATHNKIKHVIWYSFWVAAGSLFHSGIIVAIPALLLGMMLSRPRGGKRKARFYTVNIIAAVVLMGTIYAANETGYGLGKFGGSLDDVISAFEEQELGSTLGGAAFPEWMRVRGGFSDVWKLPVRLVSFLFSPLIPFMVRSPGHLLGALDAALYLALFLVLYKNWDIVKKNRAAVVLMVIIFTLSFVYAMGVSNFGTAIRHRAKIVPALLILATGFPELRRRQKYRQLQLAKQNKKIDINYEPTFQQK